MTTDLKTERQGLFEVIGRGSNFLRKAIQLLAQAQIELGASRELSAKWHERVSLGLPQRSEYRNRRWNTGVVIIFGQPDKTTADADPGSEEYGTAFSKCRQILLEDEEEIMVYMAFPSDLTQSHFTSPLKRLVWQLGQPTDVVGNVSNRSLLSRVVGDVVVEQVR